MHKKIVRVKVRTTRKGLIEPDIELEKGMDLKALEYSGDTTVCLVVRSDKDDFTKLQGKDLEELEDHPKFNDKLIRKRDKDGKITDSLNAAEIGTTNK